MTSVFIADDHAVVRDGLRALMEDYEQIEIVGEASSGTQAVNAILALKPEVVLMDIHMPDMDGLEATRQVLEKKPETRVIILSMLGTPEHIYQAMQAGVKGYLLKESAGREVVEAVLAVAAGKVYLSQQIATTLIDDYLRQRGQAKEKDPLDTLSQREREILKLVIDGLSSMEIAELLHLSPKTVESYRSRMMSKLGVSDLPSLMRFAMQAGLFSK